MVENVFLNSYSGILYYEFYRTKRDLQKSFLILRKTFVSKLVDYKIK